MINVTKPYLPNKEKYKKYIDEIYDREWLTNNGPLVQQLEKRLTSYLGVKNLILVSNGTQALEVSYMALGLQNEVITTPFSFVATTSSLLANKIKPIFCDINQDTLTIDNAKIESYINKNTSAIVATHVFGNACDIEKIDNIQKKHRLKVIYDAAHAFGVKYKGQSILNYGDISTLSFHATKLFHTIEGGAIITNDDCLAKKIRTMINFGIADGNIVNLGINAKMNELEAAMGLCVLDDIDELFKRRKELYKFYKEQLKSFVEFPQQNILSSKNYSYFPIIFRNENILCNVLEELNRQDIYPRRYFNPSLDTLDYINSTQKMLISRDISSRILCLPLYPELTIEEQSKIVKIIKGIV